MCQEKPKKKSKGTPIRAKHGQYCSNGWFMLFDPISAHIVSVIQQREPENNAIVCASLNKVIANYPRLDCFIYDRNCKFEAEGRATVSLKQIKVYPIDKWHAYKHDESCQCSHLNVPSHKRRLKNINTSIAEQSFSWFRGYAKSFNELRPIRHRFLVLYFSAKHNALCDAKDMGHLNANKPSKKRGYVKQSKGYACRKRK